MKFYLILFFFLTIFSKVSSNTETAEQGLTANDSIISADTALFEFSADSVRNRFEKDSLLKAYSVILYSLRSQNEQLEVSLIRAGRIIATLLILIIGCFLLFAVYISRKKLFRNFPYYRQKKGYQPGIVCLQIMYKYFYGKRISYKNIIKNSPFEQSPNYLSIDDLAITADSNGFDMKVLKADLRQLFRDLELPLILYMPNHMSVLYAIKNDLFYLSDPYYGHVKLNMFYFATSWFTDTKNLKGIAIQLYPLKNVRNAMNRKLDLEKFTRLKSWDRKNWKNYGCELDLTIAE